MSYDNRLRASGSYLCGTDTNIGARHGLRLKSGSTTWSTDALSKIPKFQNPEIYVCSKSGSPVKVGQTTGMIEINPQPKLDGYLENFKEI